MKTETWYVLEDGAAGDPREISADAAGVLRHKDGRAVEYRPHGPRSRSIDPDVERAKAASAKAPAESRDTPVAVDAPEEKAPTVKDREIKAAGDAKKYKTR